MISARDLAITIVLAIVLSFVIVNVNAALGIVFFMFLFTYFLIQVYLKRPVFPIEADKKHLSDITAGIVGLAAFFLMSVLLTAIFSQSIAGEPFQQSVFKLASQASITPAKPILEANLVANYVMFGLVIPFIESLFFFGGVYPFLARKFQVNLSSLNFRNNILIVVMGAMFALFHLTARAVVSGGQVTIESIPFLSTALFGVITLLIVNVRRVKELSSIIWKHALWNTAVFLFIIQNTAFLSVFGLT